MSRAVASTTGDRRPVMWEEYTLKGPDFSAVITLVARKGDYEATLHLGTTHCRVKLYTRSQEEAKKRAEQLYDLSCGAIDEIARAAEIGFHLRSELNTNDSHDA